LPGKALSLFGRLFVVFDHPRCLRGKSLPALGKW
jgi:hypothetical protein